MKRNQHRSRLLAVLVSCASLLASFVSAQEVEFTWSHFWTGTNPLAPFRDVLIEGFNEKYVGKYKVVSRETPGDPAHEERILAEAAIDQLPDLVTCNNTCIKRVIATGKATDLTDFVTGTPWGERFIDGAFDPYFSTADFKFDGTGDRLFAIPYTLDNVGIYYNMELLKQAGVEALPATWDEFFAASQKLVDAGVIPFAADGDWVTQLLWANLIGTQEGGAEWLSQPGSQNFSDEIVVTATQRLVEYAAGEYTNLDAYTGDYNIAATLFLQGQAAMIANGPWMINNIKNPDETSPGLVDNVVYSIAPNSGVIQIVGEQAFAVGTKDPAKIEAAVAFIEYVTSPEMMVQHSIFTNRDGLVKDVVFSDEDRAQINPMVVSISEAASAATYKYPHAKNYISPAANAEWINLWPDLARGNMSVEEFLQQVQTASDTAQ
jgi:raffinose/stachyose/melibiose transport system substrate-binding protein